MIKKNVSKKRICTTEIDGSCFHCGKKVDLPNAITKTMVFEDCSISDITARLEEFFENIYYRRDTVRITIVVSER